MMAKKKNKKMTKEKPVQRNEATFGKAIAAFAFISIAALLWMLATTGTANDIGAAPVQSGQAPVQSGQAPTASADQVRIPLSELSSTVKKYDISYNGKTITYMVVLGSDGAPRTAFDACEVCGGAKGYRQSGTDMICNNCGRHFKIDSLGTENMGGGCWPSHITHIVEDGYVVIEKDDLYSGARFF